MPAEPPASFGYLATAFDCRATAAVLRSGSNAALAGHVAAVMSLLPLWKGGLPAAIAFGCLLVWCLVVYLGIRVKIDVSFFELLAAHPAEHLDDWLRVSSLRKNSKPGSIPERRQGALRLWRALLATVAAQITLLLVALSRLLA